MLITIYRNVSKIDASLNGRVGRSLVDGFRSRPITESISLITFSCQSGLLAIAKKDQDIEESVVSIPAENNSVQARLICSSETKIDNSC